MEYPSDATPARSRSAPRRDESPTVTDTHETLLDLSDWPQPPRTAGPSRSGLPPRPVRRGRWPARLRPSPRAGAVAAAALGALVLVAPTGPCGSALSARLASSQALPSSSPPAVGAARVDADQRAVAAAQASLAAYVPPSGPAAVAPTPAAAAAVAAAGVSAATLDAAQARVTQARSDADAAQSELNQLLAEQAGSSDPASYDEPVATAQRRLDEAEATLEADQLALTALRSRAAAGATARPAPKPLPDAGRAALAASLAQAQRTRAVDLAAREAALQTWRADHAARMAEVSAHNTRVARCAAGAAVPAGVGVGLLGSAAVVGALARRRRR